MTITAAVLCGGQGTRLRPVIGDLPKCLAPVAGKPFLNYLLEHLHRWSIEKVVLCTGYGGQQIEDFYGPDYAGMPLLYSREDEPLGTGGALRQALPLLDSDPVLVLNGDTFCKFDLTWLLQDRKPEYGGSSILFDVDRNTGVRLISRTCIERMPKETTFDLDEYLLGSGRQSFIDIGTPEGYAGAEAFLRQQGVIP